MAITIAGSAVKFSEARKSASRVALPATNCAVTAPAQTIAVIIEREDWREGVSAPREGTRF